MQPWTIVDEPLTFNTFSQYFFANGIFRFRIPMLFIISGYLFALHDEKPHLQRIKKRAGTLLVPYFLWSITGLLVAVVFTQFEATRDVVYRTHLQPYNKPFNEYDVHEWLTAVAWPTSFQLWFLRCLFVYNLFYPLLLRGVLKIPAVIFILFGLMWLATFGIIFIEGEGLLFFTLGIWLCKRHKEVEHKPRWLNLPVITFVFIAAAFAKTWLAFKGLNSIGQVTFPLMIILHKLAIFSGLLVIWFGCDSLVKYFMEKKWFIRISAYAFIIYALHVPLIIYLIDPALKVLEQIPNYRVITFVILPTIIIGFCIFVGWIMRKTIPTVYSILTGGRGI